MLSVSGEFTTLGYRDVSAAVQTDLRVHLSQIVHNTVEVQFASA